MHAERRKMLAGELYDPGDPELTLARERARDLCRALNDTRASQHAERRRIAQELFGTGGDSVHVEPPFHCDYGSNIHLGARVFFNFGCVVLDVCEVRIGEHTLLGPGVQLLTPLHPMDAPSRRVREFGKPILIGADVWIGGGALVLAGVHIGSRSVIGAGSVVVRDVPAAKVVAGNPARILRDIDDRKDMEV